MIGPLAGAAEVTAVMLTGGSAFGLRPADGAMRWREERGRGYTTPGGLVPIVPAAVIYDLARATPARARTPDAGYAACEAAAAGGPERGRVGAGTGAAVGKILGRETRDADRRRVRGGAHGPRPTVAAIAVVNAFGDVIGDDGAVLAGAHGADGETVPTTAALAAMTEAPDWTRVEERNTTLVCVMTDAPLDKPACTRVARMASGGVARAVDPVFSSVDGDVAFCLASGEIAGPPTASSRSRSGALAATVTAAAIRDSVRATATIGSPAMAIDEFLLGASSSPTRCASSRSGASS